MASTTWADTGLIRVNNYLSEDQFAALRKEAADAMVNATVYERAEASAHRDGSFASPAHCRMAGGGQALYDLLSDKKLLLVLREMTGIARLTPFGAAYVCYQEGDFQGLHTDDLKSTLTLGIALTDNLAPMGWAPGLRGTWGEEMAKVAAEYGMFPDPDAHEAFAELEHPHGPGLLQGWAGYDIPHWRAPHTDTVPALLATLSYMSL